MCTYQGLWIDTANGDVLTRKADTVLPELQLPFPPISSKQFPIPGRNHEAKSSAGRVENRRNPPTTNRRILHI